MYKYFMFVNDTEYVALFNNHFNAADFIDAVIEDGSKVIVNGYKFVTIDEILQDNDLEWSYRVEMVASVMLPDANSFKKWSEQENELRRLGIIA